ncbi:glycoside hydrolase family 10 protein [Belliella filtrata]|nr:family 10 glycosylhydrolase [Belliella filtrata]
MMSTCTMKYFLIIFLTIHVFFPKDSFAQNAPKREMRAAWIATVENIDWPNQRGLSSQLQKEQYVKLLDQLKASGMNAIIMQIRPTADTFYPSSYEPWSAFLTGEQSAAPDSYYNPLTFMIEEARKRGLEFHAWFNPYRASMSKDFTPSDEHPMVKHPEWFVKYGGKWYYDPGIPEARAFVFDAIMEVVKHYDLDAVHFDDYFYPYKVANENFPDDKSYEKYGRESYEDIDEWRRYNVDFFVEELSQRIKQEKPFVKFGISPFGVWRNKDKDPRGSDTQAGVTNYDDLYADVLKWLEKGWIDYITPQLYWHIGFEKAEYKTLVKWWEENSFGRHLYIGQGIYRVGEKGWEDPEEIKNQVEFNRTFENIHGSMYFSAKTIGENKRDINTQLGKIYSYPALIPEMQWIKSDPPSLPQILTVEGSPRDGIKLTWKDQSVGNQAYYVIYRSEAKAALDTENPAHILTIIPKSSYTEQVWVDHKAQKRQTYTYQISAVNRLHQEGELSEKINVMTKGEKKAVQGNVKKR